nr:HAMP domain-containing sensor histidine kinase [Saccharopolyspora sp. HNM0983]
MRGRLLVVLVGATALGLLAMGAASHLILQKSLTDHLDEQLREMSRPWERPGPPPTPPDDREPRGGPGGLPTAFRVITFDRDGRELAVEGPQANDPGRPLVNRAALAGEFTTVPDNLGGADWRVRTVISPDGTTRALALSTEAVVLPLRLLLVIELVVGAAVIAVLAVGAAWTVRLGLRPLNRIEHTADAIATGELDRRIPDQDPDTETGRLGLALNTMLGRLTSALHEREQSEQRLRRFVADASHELRTPLTSIRGFAELYRHSDEPEPEAVRGMMARIEGEAVRMSDLVEDLLLLARLDRERTAELAEADLVPIAREVADAARVRDPDRDIALVAPDSPIRALVDGPRLRQVLTNLAANALLHTAAGTPVRIAVGSETAAEPGPASAGAEVEPGTPVAVVSVRDRGPGIPAEHAARIFDRFYRLDGSRDRSGGGTGLGLAIAAAIVETHGGRIEWLPEPAGGSTFRVVLPLR